MVALVVSLVLAAQAGVPSPPFKRLSTIDVEGSGQRALLVHKNSAFFIRGEEVMAYDLPSGEKLWTHALEEDIYADHLAIDGGVLYVSTSPERRMKDSKLLALDPESGNLLWSLPRQGRSSAIAIDSNTLYTSLSPYHISALDLETKKPKWTTELPKKTDDSWSRGALLSVLVVSGRVAVHCEPVTYCLDVESGKILWSEPVKYLYFGTPLVAKDGVLLVPSDNGIVARALSSGEFLWRNPEVNYGDFAAVFGRWFVTLYNGRIQALEPETGNVAWSHTVGPENAAGFGRYGSVFGNTLFIGDFDSGGVYDNSGKELWRGPREDTIAQPIWTDGTILVCFDRSRILWYEHGEPDPLPEDAAARQALAARMISNFDALDPSEVKRLESLGDDAFEAVLQAFLKAGAAYDPGSESDDNSDFYRQYRDLQGPLQNVTTPKRTDDLVEAFKKTKPGASERTLLLRLIGEHGDPNVVTPLFLDALKADFRAFGLNRPLTGVALNYVVKSDHPDATKYMIELLNNPETHEEVRFKAYVNLARTGGQAGLDAVLANRRSRELLRPLEDRLELEKVGSRERGLYDPILLDEKSDAEGRTWGLLQSGILASRGDLWIAEKVDGKWVRPLFSGVSRSGVSGWAEPRPPEPTVRGKMAKELVDGAWFDVLVGNPDLASDADGDGLTDVVEARLSTDPNKKDTDDDGDPDGVDPWPNAPRHSSLSDAEQVLAAAFEARYHFYGSEVPAIFFAPQGMEPFEMVGWRGPVVWHASEEHERWSTPLEWCYQQGVAFIGFRDYGQQGDSRPWSERCIRWNDDRTEATVTIST
ncbi:MAG: PQQ-like beta-propeller repeat protein, partial [Armatimonadetes bacterium]|nr:PQQ-like beta-propeller repeat protein [Armatimonadota bacterium]